MFACWNRKNIKPSEFYNMNAGEKMIIQAFIEKEIEIEKEQAKANK
ncbi:hypothetical protein [Clostridium sp.]